MLKGIHAPTLTQTALALALATCCNLTHASEASPGAAAQSAAAKDKRDVAVIQQEMQTLSQRMAELAIELRAHGGAAGEGAFAYHFDSNANPQGPRSIRVERFANPANLGGGVALGVLLEDSAEGAKIIGVTPGSGAASAGLRIDDVLTALNVKRLAPSGAVSDLRARVKTLKAGDKVQVSFLRDGKSQTLDVELKNVPRVLMFDSNGKSLDLSGFDEMSADSDALRERVMLLRGKNPESSIRILQKRVRGGEQTDLDLIALNPDLARYFGVSQGALVLKVQGYAPLLSGDVIQEINGRAIAVPSDVPEAMALRTGQAQIDVTRHGKRMSLNVSVPAE
jgi:S1-C subfamily serine protease